MSDTFLGHRCIFALIAGCPPQHCGVPVVGVTESVELLSAHNPAGLRQADIIPPHDRVRVNPLATTTILRGRWRFEHWRLSCLAHPSFLFPVLMDIDELDFDVCFEEGPDSWGDLACTASDEFGGFGQDAFEEPPDETTFSPGDSCTSVAASWEWSPPELPIDTGAVDNQSVPPEEVLSEAPALVAPVAPSVVRRRLRSKQPRPPGFPCVDHHRIHEGGHDIWPKKRKCQWMSWCQREFEKLAPRMKYKRVYNKWHYCSAGASSFCKSAAADCSESQGSMSSGSMDQGEAIYIWLKSVDAPVWLRDWWHTSVRTYNGDGGEQSSRPPRGKSFLLTWNGSWGLLGALPDVSLSSVVPACAQIAKLPSVCQLWEAFLGCLALAVQSLGVEDWAASLELCTETSTNESVRLHAHAFFMNGAKMDLTKSLIIRHLQFRCCTPHVGGAIMGLRHRGTGNWAGMYYLLAPKASTVMKTGTKEPFSGFPVNPSWIMTMLSGGKMNFDAARAESCRIPNGISRRVQDLERFHLESSRAALTAHVTTRQQKLLSQKSPWRRIAAIETWKREHALAVRPRKKFLVVEGGSGLGKTEFVRQLFGDSRTFEINARGTNGFSLREFKPMHHQCILWDECLPETVLNNRKLFQCQAQFIELGASPTANFVYQVWLNDTCMVICSNDWSVAVAALQGTDKSWICDNQVHIVITEPLWVVV